MPRDPKLYLWEAHHALETLQDLPLPDTYQEYVVSKLHRYATERLLITVGEALARASALQPDLEQVLPDLRKIIGFRNIAVHGYHSIDNEQVWRIVQEDIAPLKQSIYNLLKDDPTFTAEIDPDW
jgi:uncharacterized protein with HEPN domain